MGRMTEWREAQRRRAGGMVEISIWVPQRAASFLREIFARLADTGERGDDFRAAVSPWLYRRRVVGERYTGTMFSAEIDRPSLGTSWYSRPAGGRVIQAGEETWVELTPEEAEEVRILCKDAVTNTLDNWINNKGLRSRIVDKVGVALGTSFSRGDFVPGPNDIVFRPESDESFLSNEVEIAQEVKEEAIKRKLHHNDAPTVVYYPGIGGLPSRCHVIHRRVGRRVLFAMGHIVGGGTSPTNMINILTKRLHRQFYPDVKFSDIEWFDCCIVPWGDSRDVTIAAVSEVDGHPTWGGAGNLPDDFIDEIRQVLRSDAALVSSGRS